MGNYFTELPDRPNYQHLIANKQEGVPLLSDAEIDVLKSGYIDAFDGALSILEQKQQLKPQDIFNRPGGR